MFRIWHTKGLLPGCQGWLWSAGELRVAALMAQAGSRQQGQAAREGEFQSKSSQILDLVKG